MHGLGELSRASERVNAVGSSVSFLFCIPVRRAVVRKGWTQVEVANGWIQVIRGPPKSVQWPRVSKDGKPQQQWRQPGPTPQLGRWRQPLNGRQGQPQVLKTGFRAPHPDEKASAAQERVSKLEAALKAVGDDDTAPSLRQALQKARQQAVPLSTQEKVTQCESFLERARKREAAARELVLQAQSELTRLSAEVAEGEQRLATLRAELERPQPQAVAVDMSAEVERLRALLEQSSKEKEDGHLQMDHQCPNPKRACRREDFVPHCDEEMQEWIEGRQKDLQAAIGGRPAPRSRKDFPTLVHSSAGVAADSPRPVFSDAFCSGEHGEVIAHQCGLLGVRVGGSFPPWPCKQDPWSAQEQHRHGAVPGAAMRSVQRSLMHRPKMTSLWRN